MALIQGDGVSGSASCKRSGVVNITFYAVLFFHMHSGRKLHAVLTDCKNIQAGNLKKSQVLRLRCKKVCAKCK